MIGLIFHSFYIYYNFTLSIEAGVDTDSAALLFIVAPEEVAADEGVFAGCTV